MSYNSQTTYEVKRTTYSGSYGGGGASLSYSGSFGRSFLNEDVVKAIAKRIFEQYDRNRDGNIDNYEAGSMLGDTYRIINKGFSPNRQDIDSYLKVLDKNGDGRIDLEDIEEGCFRMLLGISAPKKKREVVKRAKFSMEVERHLELARRLFNSIDVDSSGFITEDEVYDLLKKFYQETLGINRVITKEDVTSWMEMTDTNRDGQVTLEEYEDLVIKALKDCGMVIEQDHIKL